MGGDKSKKKGFLFLHRRESEQALVVAGGRSMSGKARVTKKVYLQFTGYDQRLFPYVEHIAWAARQIPTMHVSGPTPLPRKTFRRTVLKSPFKYGAAREAWERRSHRRLIVYETDAETDKKFRRFLHSVLEPVAALKVTEHSYHKLDNFYRKSLVGGKK